MFWMFWINDVGHKPKQWMVYAPEPPGRALPRSKHVRWVDTEHAAEATTESMCKCKDSRLCWSWLVCMYVWCVVY